MLCYLRLNFLLFIRSFFSLTVRVVCFFGSNCDPVDCRVLCIVSDLASIQRLSIGSHSQLQTVTFRSYLFHCCYLFCFLQVILFCTRIVRYPQSSLRLLTPVCTCTLLLSFLQ